MFADLEEDFSDIQSTFLAAFLLQEMTIGSCFSYRAHSRKAIVYMFDVVAIYQRFYDPMNRASQRGD